MSAKKNTVDMTVGNPTRHLLLFAFPLFVGNMFQQFYNMVDSLVVGNYVGANALAATGSCGSLNFLFFALSSGLAIGIGIIVSQYFGAKDEKNLRLTIASSHYVLIIASICASLLGIFLARPLLELMSTPEEIINDAIVYLRTTCCGIIFIAIYNGVASVLRALGDSKTPLYFLILSSLCNISLDLLFVLVFNLGVFGVALATVVAQAICAIVSYTYARIKVSYFNLTKEEMQPHRDIIRRSFELGVPMALQSSMIAISMVVIQGVVNSFGATVMAAYTITCKVDLVVSQFYNALSSALTTFCGQNLGAGYLDRVRSGYKRGHIMVLIYNLIAVPIIFLLSNSIVGCFVQEAPVIEIGTTALMINSLMYFFLGSIYVPRGALNGCGDAKFSLINGITEVACRIIYAYGFTGLLHTGQWGIWYATGLTWCTVAIVCNTRYLRGRWQLLKGKIV